MLKLNYDYGTSDNNRNIKSQMITVPTVGSNAGFTAVQTYTYDSLNRLKDAKEMIGTTETWKQTFTFDRYGNRNFDEANTTTLPKNCGTSPNFTVCAADRKVLNPSVNTSNNRLSTSDDYTFDNSGNTTKDAQSRKFTYDGENKQIKVETVNSGGTVTGTLGEYFYDGDGKRVKKVSATETTIFVYDASGQMVAEYSTQLATTPQVSYLTTDHLGSPRINTNENGAVTARHDYQPFGEEITTSQRITDLGYNLDEIRKKFTSYERDNEIDLDFAQARYFNSINGRYITVDPYNIIFERQIEKDGTKAATKLLKYISIPQHWNKYIYVTNNPLKYVDPTGEILRLNGSKSDNEQIYGLLQKMVGEKGAKNLSYTVEEDGSWTINYKDERGGLAIGGEFGVALENIIDSSTIVSLRITDNLVEDTGFGKKVDLASAGYNGGYTGLGESGATINIIIHRNVVNMANEAFSDTNFIGTDRKILKMSFTAAIAHELGHAWGAIQDNDVQEASKRWVSTSDIRDRNNDRAVRLENVERQRLGMPLRYQHNP